MADVIDGKAVAAKVRAELSGKVQAFRAEHGRAPELHVVLVGEDPASVVYVRNKEKGAAEIGMGGRVHRLPATTSEEKLLSFVKELNSSAEVDGILVQFPVPAGIRQAEVIRAIDPRKDVDGLSAQNAGALWTGQAGLVPCTPRGCMRLLAEYGVKPSGATNWGFGPTAARRSLMSFTPLLQTIPPRYTESAPELAICSPIAS